jgi:RNA polymerase sigma factor (sigma-70 family)
MAKTPEQLREELLVLGSQAGDREAFAGLVNAWQERLWRHAYRLTASDDAAWDIVQEAWVHITKGIRRLEDAAAFPAWAFRIVTNKWADRMRREGRRKRLEDDLSQEAKNAQRAAPPDANRCASLKEALARLPGDRRALLALHYAEGFGMAEIAEILGIPEGTVKSRLYHAREQLRQIMKGDRDG